MDFHPWFTKYDPGVPRHISYPDIPVFKFLDEAARLCPDRLGIVFRDISLTYQEISRNSDQLAIALVKLGIQAGDRVGLFLPNCPEYVLAYFAILKAGAIVVAINPLFTPPEILHQVNDSGVKIIFTAHDLASKIYSIRQGSGISQVILCGSQSAVDNALFFDDLVKGLIPPNQQAHLGNSSATVVNLPRITARDLALFQYTGGTTGISKAAMASHANLVANVLQFKAWMSTLEEEKETFLLALPIYHIYGMVCGMLLGIAMRATLAIIPNPRDISDLIAVIQAQRVSYFPAAPTLYNAINNHPDVISRKVDLTSIKVCISGSAALMKETKDRFEKLTGGRIIEGYGLSEAPTATHCNPVQNENRLGSIGLPLPDVEAKIVDLNDGTTDLPPGSSGELVIRSPQVMRGYHNMPEETSLALRAGWLYTGDIARMDMDGYFYIVDRKKDLIKPGGMEVWPREVEETLSAHPGVGEIAVTGIPDAYRGETVKAWVVVKKGQSPSEEELRHWCQDRLAPYKIPTHFEFLDQLPKSAVGKILKRELLGQPQNSQ